MRTYFCYVHTPHSLTPHLRIVSTALETLSAAIAGAARDWPARTLVEIFNDADQLLFRLPGPPILKPVRRLEFS
jgi:hypothetical protein